MATSDTIPALPANPAPARVVILMGVSGCGKTAVGLRLAELTGAAFVDSDDLHPPENKAKMSAKIPLTDNDRRPWLDRIRREAIDAAAAGTLTVLACSALKRAYRSLLTSGAPDVRIIYLRGSFDLIVSCRRIYCAVSSRHSKNHRRTKPSPWTSTARWMRSRPAAPRRPA
jgi:gluconokinase